MPAKLQLLAVLAFAVAMLFIENQIQRLEDSRSRLGEKCGCIRNFKIKSNSFFLSSTLMLMFKLGAKHRIVRRLIFVHRSFYT